MGHRLGTRGWPAQGALRVWCSTAELQQSCLPGARAGWPVLGAAQVKSSAAASPAKRGLPVHRAPGAGAGGRAGQGRGCCAPDAQDAPLAQARAEVHPDVVLQVDLHLPHEPRGGGAGTSSAAHGHIPGAQLPAHGRAWGSGQQCARALVQRLLVAPCCGQPGPAGGQAGGWPGRAVGAGSCVPAGASQQAVWTVPQALAAGLQAGLAEPGRAAPVDVQCWLQPGIDAPPARVAVHSAEELPAEGLGVAGQGGRHQELVAGCEALPRVDAQKQVRLLAQLVEALCQALDLRQEGVPGRWPQVIERLTQSFHKLRKEAYLLLGIYARQCLAAGDEPPVRWPQVPREPDDDRVGLVLLVEGLLIGPGSCAAGLAGHASGGSAQGQADRVTCPARLRPAPQGWAAKACPRTLPQHEPHCRIFWPTWRAQV